MEDNGIFHSGDLMKASEEISQYSDALIALPLRIKQHL